MKELIRIAILIFVLGTFVVLMENKIWSSVERNSFAEMTVSDEWYRAEFFSDQFLEKRNMYSGMGKEFITSVENDVSYFPIAESSVDKSLTTSFVNTWMSERTFGGKRRHEGIDIMASKNQRGLYPVVSMTDGIITNLGWLEKGGYRIGITSDSGIYYYYAHLESYSNVEEGQRVKAGDLLGYMGDSGYGPEGTTGQFDVHLHVGIYFYEDGKEISINPYYILCYLENKKLKYAYF